MIILRATMSISPQRFGLFVGNMVHFCNGHSTMLTKGTAVQNVAKIKARDATIKSWEKEKTTAQFISEAKEVHGDRFDYSPTKYTGYTNKIDIGCPVHGIVSTLPHIHILGHGCPICGKSAAGRSKALTTEEWVSRAKSKHGEKFDYSKSSYINQNTDVKIICPIHGEFSQLPMVHIESHGCRKCGMEILADKNRTSVEDFMKAAKEMHGNKYEYSMVEYVNSHTKVLIGCPEHGFFLQRPALM